MFVCLQSPKYYRVLENYVSFTGQSDRVKQTIESLVVIGEKLLPKIEDVAAEKMGDLVDQEMLQTTNAIEQAAKRFEVIFLFYTPVTQLILQ